MTNPYQPGYQPPMQSTGQGAADPFADPEKRQIAGRPTLRNLGLGRLIVIVPLAKHRDQPNPFFDSTEPEGKRNSRLRTYIEADVLVCDGAPFMYGGNSRDVADTFGPFPVPGVIRGMEIDKKSILDDIPETQIGGGVIVARLAKQAPKQGTGQPYWVIQKVEPGDPARSVTALQVFNAYKAGTLPTHTPPVEPQQAAAPQYGQTMPMGGQMAPVNPQQPTWPPQQHMLTPPPQGNPYGQQIGLTPAGQQVAQAAQNPYGSPPQAAPAAPAFDFASIIGQPAAPAAPVDMPPPGAPQNVVDAWPSLNPMQRDMVRQQVAAMAQQGAAPTYP